MDKITQLKSFLELDPNDSFTKFALALEYQKKNETQLAERYFVDIIDKDPNYVGVYYHLGKLYELLNKIDEATEIYKKGVNIAKLIDDSHAANELVEALLILTED